jgi:hypothetical protein
LLALLDLTAAQRQGAMCAAAATAASAVGSKPHALLAAASALAELLDRAATGVSGVLCTGGKRRRCALLRADAHPMRAGTR